MLLFRICFISKENYTTTSNSNNDDCIRVFSMDAKEFTITCQKPLLSKYVESWTVGRSALDWYLQTLFQMVLMDENVPYAFQIDFSMMPSALIKTEGCQFTVRTLLEHMRRMLEIVEKHGLPTSTLNSS